MTAHLIPGAGDNTQIAECDHCYSPLYANQPMTVIRCDGSSILNCPKSCRPDMACAAYIQEALHVGCSLAGKLSAG